MCAQTEPNQTMSDLHATHAAAQAAASAALLGAQDSATCDACLGSGGWYRYEPALENAPGLLYLSCLHCRGSGRASVLRPE